MSLINDMLQDLDGSSEKNGRIVSRDVSSKQTKGKLGGLVLPVLAVAALLYFIFIEWNVLGLLPEKNPVVLDIPKPLALNPKWLKPTDSSVEPARTSEVGVAIAPPESAKPILIEQPMVIEVSIPEVDAEKGVSSLDTSDSDTSSAVNRLLVEAERAFKQDALMTPIERNAFQYYRSVLVLDNANVAALNGLQSIRKRYYELAIAAKDQGRTVLVKSYLSRISVLDNVLNLDGGTSELHEFLASSESVIPFEGGDSGVALTVHSEDELLSSEVQHQYSAAVSAKVMASVQSGKVLTLSVQALADQLAQQAKMDELIKLHKSIGSESVAEKSYVAAQQAILSGNLLGARALLVSFQFSNAKADAHRVRLLSGVCKSANDFECALSGYQKLVQSANSQLNDWLGLAVSLDSVGNIAEAIKAYQYLVSSAHPDGRVMTYARQRILDLSSYSYRR